MSPRAPQAAVEPFTGFPEEALDFYEGLEADNSKAYWNDHREVYDRAVAAPMRSLLAALAPRFGTPKFFRPYRDVRFSKDKTPYKTHAGAVVAEPGRAAFYVQVDADGLLAAGGYWHCTTEHARALRAAVADDASGPTVVRVVNRLRREGFEIGGDQLKRIPKPWDDTHLRADLLRQKALTGSVHHPPAEWLHTPAALDRVTEAWTSLTPLNRWLERYVPREER